MIVQVVADREVGNNVDPVRHQVFLRDDLEKLRDIGIRNAFDFVAEVIPGERQSNFKWHYDLQPRNEDPAALL